MCSEVNNPSSRSCLQRTNITCSSRRQDCVEEYSYSISTAGVLVRTNIPKSTFITNDTGWSGIVDLGPSRTAYVPWTKLTSIQVADILLISPRTMLTPIDIEQYELDINPGFDLTSSQDLLRVFDNMAKANNQSLKGLIEPMVHNYKNPSGVSMEHTLLAIFLTTFPLYLTILLLTYWVIHLKRTYRTLQRALENSILNMDEPMTFNRLRAGSI